MDMDVGNIVHENPKYHDLLMTPEVLFRCLVVGEIREL